MKWIKKWINSSDHAAVLINYEYWYYSYRKNFHIKPDPISWKDKLIEKEHLSDFLVFGNFSASGIQKELDKLHQITDSIIDTSNYLNHQNMTEFVMLDRLYQMALTRKDIQTFILFTGNGYFSSVINYLIHELHKTVLIYGVEEAVDEGLISTVGKVEYLPTCEERFRRYYEMIVKDLEYVGSRIDIVPTFKGIVKAVSLHHQIEEEQIAAALAQMLEKGYLYQKESPVSFNQRVRIVCANWDLLVQDGYVSF